MSFGRGGLGLVILAIALGQPRLLAIAIVYSVVASTLVWFRRTWSFDGSTITLDDGIFNRTYRRVPVTRVQQVEVNEPLLHRMTGFAVVRIETAGAAGQAEVLLDALPRDEAATLQRRVVSARAEALARRDGATPTASPGVAAAGDDVSIAPVTVPPPEVEVLRLSTARIMLAGITGSNLLVVFALMGTLFDTISRLPREVADSVEEQAGTVVVSLGVLAVGLALVVVALVAAALSAVATHHGLTVVRAGDELRLRRGLFERRDAVVPLARVQAISIRQNPAQRLLGLASVQIRSAGSGGGGDARLSIPLADAFEIDRVLEAGVGRRVDRSDLLPAPRPALSRRLVRRVVPAAALLITSFLLVDSPWWRLVLAVVLLGVAITSGFDAYRNLGHRLDGDVLVTRVGSLLRRTVVVLVPRIQSLRDSSSPFQRVRHLATLRVDLAGRGITPAVVDQHRKRCAELDAAVRRVLAPPGSGSAGLGAPGLIRETGPPVPLPNPTNEEL